MLANCIYYLKISRLFLSHLKSRTCLLFQLCWNGIHFSKYIFRKHFSFLVSGNQQNGFVQFLNKSIHVLIKHIQVGTKCIYVSFKSIHVSIKHIQVGTKRIYVLIKHIQVEAKRIYVSTKYIQVFIKCIYVLIKSVQVRTKHIQILFSGIFQQYLYVYSNLSLLQINSRTRIKRYFQKHIKRKIILIENALIMSCFS